MRIHSSAEKYRHKIVSKNVYVHFMLFLVLRCQLRWAGVRCPGHAGWGGGGQRHQAAIQVPANGGIRRTPPSSPEGPNGAIPFSFSFVNHQCWGFGSKLDPQSKAN